MTKYKKEKMTVDERGAAQIRRDQGFFTIREVAAASGVSVNSFNYLVRLGLIEQPTHRLTGPRLYYKTIDKAQIMLAISDKYK